MSRSTIERAYAQVIFNGVTLNSMTPITIATAMPTSAVETAGMGVIDYRETGAIYDDITFTPSGKYAYASVLHPYSNAAMGLSMFGADTPLIVHFSNGIKRTYAAAAVINAPRWSGSPSRSMWGPVTFRCIRGEASAPTDASALYLDEEEAFPGNASTVASELVRQAYTVEWAASGPLGTFNCTDGVEFAVSLKTKEIPHDVLGLGDMVFDGLTTQVTLTPYGANPSHVAAYLKRQGAGAGPGRSLAATARDLTITGTGVVLVLTKAVITTTDQQYGGGENNQGQLTFVGTREHDAGTLRPWYLFTD